MAGLLGSRRAFYVWFRNKFIATSPIIPFICIPEITTKTNSLTMMANAPKPIGGDKLYVLHTENIEGEEMPDI